MGEIRDAWQRRRYSSDFKELIMGFVWLILLPIPIICFISAFKPEKEPERQLPPVISPEGEIHTFTISEGICKDLFGLDPLDFCAQRGAESIVENAYASAHVNENGDLILKVADNQLLEWKRKNIWYQVVQLIMGRETTPGWDPADDAWAAHYIEIAPISGIEIAEDYSWYIVDFDKDYDMEPFLTFGTALAQLYEKKSTYEISYDVTYRYEGEVWVQFNSKDGAANIPYPEGIGPGFHPTDTDSDSSSSKVQ